MKPAKRFLSFIIAEVDTIAYKHWSCWLYDHNIETHWGRNLSYTLTLESHECGIIKSILLV